MRYQVIVDAGCTTEKTLATFSRLKFAMDWAEAMKGEVPDVHESIRVTEFLSSGEAVDFWVAHSDDGND